jgi:hypothetical protein
VSSPDKRLLETSKYNNFLFSVLLWHKRGERDPDRLLFWILKILTFEVNRGMPPLKPFPFNDTISEFNNTFDMSQGMELFFNMISAQ